jgi:hypothetical protein
MNRNQIKRVGNACVKLAENALILKMGLPVFGADCDPDWPVVAGEVRQLRADMERIEQLLGETQPVHREDIQWRLCKYVLPDDSITVLVSIKGEDDTHEAFLDRSDFFCWRYLDAMPIEGEVYAWADMPPSLNLRQAVRLALPSPVEERRAS